MTRSKGSILVLALWTLSVLTFFALSLGFGVRQKATLLNRLSTLDALYPIAYSGVENAKSLVRSDLNTDVDMLADPWGCAVSRQVDISGGHFLSGTVTQPGLVDEERKINLNTASPEMILKLLLAIGVDRDRAEETTYCLLDWADSDSFFGHPKYGAEDRYYGDLKYPYGAKDAPYELMDELLLVKGVTPQLLEQIRPYVTVYGRGKVNMNTAPREVLAALGFSDAGIKMIQDYRAGRDRIEGTSDDDYFSNATTLATELARRGGPALTNDQAAVLNGLNAASRLGVSSSVFSVRVHAVLERNGASMDLDAVIDRKGNVLDCHASEVKL